MADAEHPDPQRSPDAPTDPAWPAPDARTSTEGEPRVRQIRPPRAGELTPGWRLATALVWLSVIIALAAVWNASVQLGLSTWWLGARGEPQPRVVQLSPFVAPVLMLLGAINQTRRLAWFGLAASVVVATYGVIDLGRVWPIGVLEILIAMCAAGVSLASLTGTYRRVHSDTAAATTTPTS